MVTNDRVWYLLFVQKASQSRNWCIPKPDISMNFDPGPGACRFLTHEYVSIKAGYSTWSRFLRQVQGPAKLPASPQRLDLFHQSELCSE
jgi:hypothetical protein